MGESEFAQTRNEKILDTVTRAAVADPAVAAGVLGGSICHFFCMLWFVLPR